MLSTKIFIKLPWLLLLAFVIYFSYTYHCHDEHFLQQSWNYYIHHQQFQHSQTLPHLAALKLEHEGEGHYEPLNLEITTKDNQVRNLIIDDLNHTHIDEQLQLQKNQIKHAIIKSTHPLNFNKGEKVRLLQDITQEDDFVLISVNFFSFLLPLIRNLLIVGVLFNQVDFFLPLILMNESILMLAFLDNEKHYLGNLYKIVFNSNLDILNFIRMKIFAVNQKDILNVSPLLARYGFGQNILYNLSGQLALIIGFLVLTIFVKIGGALLKFEKLRSAGSKMRGIWNGIVFCFLPKILTFSSFSIRQMSFDNFEGAFNPLIGILLVVAYIVFLVQLWFQIRRVNERIQYFEESRHEIGLVTRIHHKRKFQFDCMRCSNLYYPIINLVRLFIFFIPIGASYDFTYGSFGGVIVSQMIFIMFSVSSSGFIKSRDSVIYPFCDFLLMALQLTHIAIGLAQNVKHSEVTIIAEKVFFSIHLVIYFQLIGSICADISGRIRQFFIKNGDLDVKREDKSLKTTKFKRTIKRKATQQSPQSQQSPQQTKSTWKTTYKTQRTEKKQSVYIDDSIQDDQSQKDTPFNYQRALTHVRPKIRKVRQGKII